MRLLRYSVSIVILLLSVSSAHGAIAKVQSRGVTYSSVSNPQTLAFSSNTVAGNTIVAMCGAFATFNDNIPAIFDSANPTMRFTTVFQVPGSNFHMVAAVYTNIAGGADTITCDISNGTFFSLIIAEYSGVDTRFPVDTGTAVGAYSASGSTKSAGAITTIQANEAILTFYYDDHNNGINFSATINNSFVIQEQSSTFGTNTQAGFADKIVSSIQTGLNPTWSDAGWATDGVTLITFGLREAFSSAPAISVVQTNGGTASAASVSAAFSSGNASGNLILVGCLGAQAAVPTLTISDSVGNTYTQIDTLSNAAQTRTTWWYAKNIGSGANTVTCSSSLTGTALHVAFIEYHGIDGTTPLDQHTALYCSACGTDPISSAPAAITTTGATELVAIFYTAIKPSSFGTSVYPTNYTFRMSNIDTTITTRSMFLADQYLTATGTYQPYGFIHSQDEFFSLSVSFFAGPSPSAVRHKAQVI